MKTIAIIAQKGGVGKSKISSHLGALFASSGYATAIIDLDPQASTTKWADRREDDDPVVISAHASRLGHELDRVREAGCEVVVIDTAPHANDAALEAGKVADLLLLPCCITIDDLDAMPSTINIAKLTGTPYFAVLNRTAPVGSEADELAAEIEAMGAPVCPVRLGDRVAYKRCGLEGLTVAEYIPPGKTQPDPKAVQEIRHLYMFACEKVGMTASKHGDVSANQHDDMSATDHVNMTESQHEASETLRHDGSANCGHEDMSAAEHERMSA